MKWPRGRYNGARIVGIDVRVRFDVTTWGHWCLPNHVAEDAVRRFEWGYGFASVGRWLAKEARRRIKNERRTRKEA